MSRAAPSACRQPAASPVARAEDRHQAVAQVLVDLAAMAADGFAHLREQAVENEHHVVGQRASLIDVKPARIEKQDGEVALHALSLG